MSRAQNALMRLYEDADLRDELTDDEAEQMLKWAEGELTRLDAASADDIAFEAHAETLMGLLKKMNRFAGRQGQASAQAVDPAPTNISALATELGHAASAEQIAAAGTGDPAGTITALTALMSAAANAGAAQIAEAAPAQAVAAESAAAAAPTETQAEPPTTKTPPAEPYPSPSGDPFDEFVDL